MTRYELMTALFKFDWNDPAEWDKPVIIDAGTGPPFADVERLGPPNEDTVVIVAPTVEGD